MAALKSVAISYQAKGLLVCILSMYYCQYDVLAFLLTGR
jgi:hypothetical protein